MFASDKPVIFAVRHAQCGLVNVVVDIVAEYYDVAVFPLHDVAKNSFLLHQYLDETPVAGPVLKAKCVDGIFAAQLELELMVPKSIVHQDFRDYLPCGLVLIRAGCVRIKAADMCLDHDLEVVDVLGGFCVREMRDPPTPYARSCAWQCHRETGLMAENNVALEFDGVRCDNVYAVRFTGFFSEFKGHD
ncbi:hypothetical protein AWB64_06203 [Caballeronia sordidicola]|uniref:Uncharacterized protein n=1 Tax=Caballeronia sordidicola TaxID=196367 RepID=A0A158IHK5_CABSO|nr:hypothetical protein AWB64_06203 [Caballeronia sordidicola]